MKLGWSKKQLGYLSEKIQEILGDKEKLKGDVHADEMIVGGHSTGTEHRGRSLKEKSGVVVAAEILDDGRTGISILKQSKILKLTH
jgi:hypothetical protein